MKTKMFAVCAILFLFSGIVHADLEDGLVAYYPFNGNANDKSGNGNNGTVYGATLTKDRFGKANSAYYFNGSSYISISDQLFLNNSCAATINAWVMSQTTDTEWHQIIGSGDSRSGEDPISTQFVGNELNNFGFSDTTQYSIRFDDSTSVPINGNVWQMVTIILKTTTNSSTMQLYYDGLLKKSSTTDNRVCIKYDIPMGTKIGAIEGGQGWLGLLDDIRIYNRALSESEIQRIYLEGTNKSPTITSFTATPKSGNPPLMVNFNVAAKDPDGSISAYQWDFDGNGKIDNTTTIGNIEHTYPDLGTFNAKVIILDNKGGKAVSKPVLITTAHGPDLVGKVETYDFSDPTNTIHIDLKVSNTGNIPTPSFNVRFHLSNNGKTLLPAFKEMTVSGGLGVEASTVLSVDNTFEDSIYGKYVFVIIDPTKQVAEIDETNNGTRIVIQPVATK